VGTQRVEGLGMADPGENLGSPWPPLAISPCMAITTESSTQTSNQNFNSSRMQKVEQNHLNDDAIMVTVNLTQKMMMMMMMMMMMTKYMKEAIILKRKKNITSK
jgi:hypothetical protein